MTNSGSSFLNRMLFCPEGKAQRSSQIWHTVFSILNALQSTLMLFLVTRMFGSEKAGVISTAFSIAYLMIMIGNYGVRNFQATDLSVNFGFREYRMHRRATCTLMAAASIAYVLFRGYEPEKAAIVLLCCLLKVIESIENVYHAEYQRASRLDTASKIGTIRLGMTLLVFVIGLAVTGSILISFAAMVLTAAVLLAALLLYTRPRISVAEAKKPTDWKQIFVICLPLFLSSFCYIYICNASKYALDVFATEAEQGFYGMIFMPVFTINLISNCIYGPFLVRLAGYWQANRMEPMKRFVMLQTAALAGLCAAACGAGYLLGTQVLSVFYGCDLSEFRIPLVILLVGSGMTAMVDFTNNVLTVIRKQKALVWIYGVFAVFSFFCTRLLVTRFSIAGAAYAYTLVMTLQAAVMFLYLMQSLRKGNRTPALEN